MAKRNYPKVTLFNNYYGESGYTFNDYKEDCIIRGLNEDEIGAEDSNEYDTWVDEMLSIDWNALISNLEKNCDFSVVVVGSCGTWRGDCQIIPKKFNGVLNAVYACIRNCDEWSIELTDGEIKVISSHHDGTNHLTIKQISKKGENVNWDGITSLKPYMTKKNKWVFILTPIKNKCNFIWWFRK